MESTVESGLRQLAFGSCNDAVKLAFSEDMPAHEEIARLDLFGLSEIKRDKNGGVELKFCDRIKALEKLYVLQNAGNSRETAEALIRALTPETVDVHEA